MNTHHLLNWHKLHKAAEGTNGLHSQTLYSDFKKENRVRRLHISSSLTAHILGGASSNAFLSLIHQKISVHSVTPLWPWKETQPMSQRPQISVNANIDLFFTICHHMDTTGDRAHVQ